MAISMEIRDVNNPPDIALNSNIVNDVIAHNNATTELNSSLREENRMLLQQMNDTAQNIADRVLSIESNLDALNTHVRNVSM